MPRSLTARILTALFAATAALAAPGNALAHGETHHHAAEHGEHRATPGATVEWSASAPAHGHGHDHPRLDGPTRTRQHDVSPATPVVRAPDAEGVSAAPATVARTERIDGAGTSTGPPPRLRAPPTR